MERGLASWWGGAGCGVWGVGSGGAVAHAGSSQGARVTCRLSLTRFRGGLGEGLAPAG